jgi:glycosyltransferase involved in cell wall biosynthesis
VTVFCETDEVRQPDRWQGVERIFLARRFGGAAGTIAYDLESFRRVRPGSVALLFGYGTAIFQPLLRARRVPHAVNMDGIEWKRAKWGHAARWWLRLNEALAARVADVLIADHPEIALSIQTRFGRVPEMIAYGVELPVTAARPDPSHPLLERYPPDGFDLVIARPEPENQIRLLLEGWQASGAACPLLVVGLFGSTDYGRALMADFPTAHFAGPIYDMPVLDCLRRRARTYLHGHSVGGTNPSLIEAMAAGALVVAHDNRFNRWVLGEGGLYFRDARDLAAILASPPTGVARAAHLAAARARCEADFLWPHILARYETVVATLSDRLGVAP